MKFKSYEDKCAAVNAAMGVCGTKAAELEYAKWLSRQVQDGYVPGEVLAENVLSKEASTPTEKVVPASKKATVKKAATKKATPKKEEVVKEGVVKEEVVKEEVVKEGVVKEEVVKEEVVKEEVVKEETAATECPVTNTDELRSYMTTRYKELGGTAEARASLITALKTATGKDQAADITAEEFPAACAALAAL